jgi:site-specific DNA-methyltransferase (adenine-specific)
MVEGVELFHGDCLELMRDIPDGSVDMILCDLPYGTTSCKWDSVIPFEPLWAEYRRICKSNAAIVLTASQPFTSSLVMSNSAWFRYEWIWQKKRPVGHLNARRRPMLSHESILVFSENAPRYAPQGLVPYGKVNRRTTSGDNYGAAGISNFAEFTNYPRTVVEFDHDSNKLHPTQKPVALMEYLIRTYTNEGETVLDNCMGSGTTGVACVNTGRKFIGIEKDDKYFEVARDRINSLGIF